MSALRVGVGLVAVADVLGQIFDQVPDAPPAALDFIDAAAIEAQTGSPVRSQYREPGEPRSRRADAIIVGAATYNTINKWAQGISDTYALGILAETTSRQRPLVGVRPLRADRRLDRSQMREVTRPDERQKSSHQRRASSSPTIVPFATAASRAPTAAAKAIGRADP